MKKTGQTVFYLSVALFLSSLLPQVARADTASNSLNDFWRQTYDGGVSTTPGGSLVPAVVTPIDPNPLVDRPAYDWSLLAKASPDECFKGIGVDGTCGQNEQPNKVNQAYVFGMANTPSHLWFGTAANMQCMVLGGDFLAAAMLPTDPIITPAFVCEFGEGYYFQNETSLPPELGGGPWPPDFAGFGDHRIPQIFWYNKVTNDLEERTPKEAVPAEKDAFDLLKNTYGLRSAGALGNVVLLAGPEVGNQAVIVFAYRADTGQLIGAHRFDDWGNVRSIEVINGALYFAMQNTASNPYAPAQGSIVRWTGTQADPFAGGALGVYVGTLENNAAAFLAEHDGHLYTSTWFGLGALPIGGAGLPHPNGIWRVDAPLPATGGLPAIAPPPYNPAIHDLTEVFNFGEYEPDPYVAASYFGGALRSYGGKLYFGTINFPGASLFAALMAHQTGAINLDCDGLGLGPVDLANTALGTFRPVSLFRADNLGEANESVELLYGSPFWPSYVEGPDVGCAPGHGRYAVFQPDLVSHRNLLDQDPMYGFPGINNFFNAYIWDMEVYDNKLFVGTFDWSSIPAAMFLDVLPQAMALLQQAESLLPFIQFPQLWPGADLFRFDDPNTPAVGETVSGFTNVSNYGVRSMVSDGQSLYVGTANPMNLNVGTNGNDGGWELIRLGIFGGITVPTLGLFGLIVLMLALLGVTGYALRNRRAKL